MIKLIILDVDGILTDGKKYYDARGNAVLKTFCDKDWTAIKRFRALGIPVVFLSGDRNINEAVLANRNLPAHFNRLGGQTTPKEFYIESFKSMYGCTEEEMLYVGDDLFDIGIMRAVGHAYCTLDSPAAVKGVAHTLPVSGGDNVVMILFDILENMSLIPYVPFSEIMPKIIELDQTEKF